MPQRIVNLCPSHSRTSSTLAIAKFRHAQFPQPSAKGRLPGRAYRSRSGNLAFRSLRYFLAAFLSSENYFPVPPKLRGHGQQSGEADQYVTRLAGLQLREECRANEDERHDQQDSWILAPGPRGCKSHSNIQKIEQRQAESHFEVGGIAAITFGERPEPAGVGKQGNARSKPHGGSALDGDPDIGTNRMTLRTFPGQLRKFEIERARHAARAVVAIQQGRDA